MRSDAFGAGSVQRGALPVPLLWNFLRKRR